MRNFILATYLLTIASVYGQDPKFIQFYANPLYTNPAMAGNAFRDETPAGRITTNYRNQWPGLPGNYRTLNLSWDQHFDKLHGGLGVQSQLLSVGSGLITGNGLLATYAYQGQIKDKLQISLGLQAGINRSTLNFGRFTNYFDYYQYFKFDTNFINNRPSEKIIYPILNAGILLSGNHFYVGIGLNNLNQPNRTFLQNPNENIPIRIAVHGGYSIHLSKSFLLHPQAQFAKQENTNDLLLGLNAISNKLIYGIWFRQTFGQYHNMDAIAGNIGYNFKGFRLIYSYDVAVSDGRSAIPSSHEISLRYCWKTKQGKKIGGPRPSYEY